MRRSFLHPADAAASFLLVVIALTLLGACLLGRALWGMFCGHVALLIAYGILSLVMRRHEARSWVLYARPFAVAAVMFVLYKTLGQSVFVIWDGTVDPWLAAADRWLFLGTSPSLWLNRRLTPHSVEFLSFIYSFYIPYLYFSIVLGCIGRPRAEVGRFVTAYSLTYSISFLGYLFVPARGPIVELAGQFAQPLDGGAIHALVVNTIAASGGPHGAFPSLHVGASMMLCLFDLRHNTFRGLTYVPLVALIVAATLALQYHYVVDLVAGTFIAIASLWLSRRLMARYTAADRVEFHGG